MDLLLIVKFLASANTFCTPSTYAAAGQIAASKEMGGLECSNNGNAKRFETHLLP